MDKIPTAEEFLKDLQSEYEETGEYKMYFAIDIPKKLIEFTKLHVKAALKAAANDISAGPTYAMEELILNAYPESNIK